MGKRTYRIKIKDGYFEDEIYESPVDEHQLKFRRRILLTIVFVLAILIAWYVIRQS